MFELNYELFTSSDNFDEKTFQCIIYIYLLMVATLMAK